MALTDAQYAAFIDRLIACREAEDAAKEDTKAVYAELADAGEDKTVAGLVVRQRRMTAKDRVKAELRDAAAEDGHSRYLRGKASHVRAREGRSEEINLKASVSGPLSPKSAVEEITPEHDAETGEIIEHETPVSHAPVQPGREEPGTTDGAASAGETAQNISSQAVTSVRSFGGDGSATSSAGMEGEADRQPHSADRTKPNPWCADPDDCGVEASWTHMCGSCLRRRDAQRSAAEVVH